jgi:hypothetical protein
MPKVNKKAAAKKMEWLSEDEEPDEAPDSGFKVNEDFAKQVTSFPMPNATKSDVLF